MTLTTRILAFSLGILVLVLIGFSATLYCMTRTELQRQIDDRLNATLNLLTVEADVMDDGVEWEPQGDKLTFANEPNGTALLWIVRTDADKVVEASREFPSNLRNSLLASAVESSVTRMTLRTVLVDDHRWRIAQRRLAAANARDATEPTSREPALTLTVATTLEPAAAALQKSAAWLIGLSLGFWLAAALSGRALCRRALLPVRRMAEAARAMQPEDREERLPDPATRDELQDLAVAFNDLLGRLHDSLERQRRFAGDASHQLRTPLAIMLGQIEVARRHDRSAEEYRQTLSAVHSQAVRLREIVEMLLFLARADSETKLSQLERIDLTAWLTEHLRSRAEAFPESELHLDLLPPGQAAVSAQTPLLGQMFDNLLDNARKYRDAATPITVRSCLDGDAVSVAIENVGDGIPPDEVPRLFTPFFRSSVTRRSGISGFGLGLTIAQRIARAFGGDICYESLPSRVTRFVVRLPMQTTVAAPAETEEETPITRRSGSLPTAG